MKKTCEGICNKCSICGAPMNGNFCASGQHIAGEIYDTIEAEVTPEPRVCQNTCGKCSICGAPFATKDVCECGHLLGEKY